jgi:2-(1,2-epoxy-1,2-dihydrophenyl)acetyl-CoA isomerase
MLSPNKGNGDSVPISGRDFETLRYGVVDNVARIVLDRPKLRNAIDLVMRRELLEAVTEVAADENAKVLLISGAGDHFCSGGDISTMLGVKLSEEEGRARMAPVIACARSLLELPKPVIVAVDGVAYGAGFGLCLCADLVIATPRARFCLSFMRLGLVPDFASAFTLPRIVGWQRAKQLIYSATEISGKTAYEYGIVSELAQPDVLGERSFQVARAMGQMSSAAFAMTKHALLNSFSKELYEMNEAEIAGQAKAFTTEYHRQAAAQILAKKPTPFMFPVGPKL